MTTNPLKKLSGILLFMVGLAFCIKELREPDMWWQLRTGEWMIENNQVTKADVFSYTYEGVEWINVKWLYEVLYAACSNIFGPEIIVFFQMASVVLMLLFLGRLGKEYLKDSPFAVSASILASFLFLFIHAARINMRPEMTTYVLTLVYVYLFLLYRKKQSNWILLVIPLQLFWTNMHEAYGVGLVMLLIFLFGSLLEIAWDKWLLPGKRIHLPKLLFGSVIGAFLIVMLNPHGSRLLTHLIEIYTQLGQNNFTLDLANFGSPAYWRPATISNIILFVICTGYLLLFKSKRTWKQLVEFLKNKYGFVYLLLYVAFFYLSLKAVRNSFFFAMIAFPIYVECIHLLLQKLFKRENGSYALCIGIGVVFYLSIVSGGFYRTFNPKEHYGIQVNSQKNPIGVSQFIKDNKIGGKGFTDYLSSSYMLWHLQPDFKTYLDLRDLDIFPATFMQNVLKAYAEPSILLASGETLFDYLVSVDDFNYIVMLNNDQFDAINFYLHQDQQYQLIYVDGLNSLYIKNDENNQGLINTYAGSEKVFHKYVENPSPKWVQILNKVFWPFYKERKASNMEQEQIKAYYFQKFQM